MINDTEVIEYKDFQNSIDGINKNISALKANLDKISNDEDVDISGNVPAFRHQKNNDAKMLKDMVEAEIKSNQETKDRFLRVLSKTKFYITYAAEDKTITTIGVNK